MQRFRGGLVFKAHRLLCDSTLGLRVMKKKKNRVEKGKETRRAAERMQPLGREGVQSAEMRSGSEEGSYARLIDVCIPQL